MYIAPSLFIDESRFGMPKGKTLFRIYHSPKPNLLLIVTAVMVILVAFFLLTNLATYPTISGWDEGMYLQFAHNLAYYGQYATRNGDVFERSYSSWG